MWTILLVFSAYCAGVVVGRYLLKLRRNEDTPSRENRKTEQAMQDLLAAETARALRVIKDLFDNLPHYRDADPKLNELLSQVAAALARYPNFLANVAYAKLSAGTATDRLFGEAGVPPELGLGPDSPMARLVQEIDDPVFNRLWEIRTPSALCEMLRHGFFLAYGFPYAVARVEGYSSNLRLPPLLEVSGSRMHYGLEDVARDTGRMWQQISELRAEPSR
jgi:hypothetical protein